VEIAAKPARGPEAIAEGSLTVGTPGVRLEPRTDSRGEPDGHDAQDGHTHGEAAAMEKEREPTRHPAEFQIPVGRLQRVGVRVAPAERKMLRSTVRAAGRVVAEETTLEDVALKVRGWVGEIYADAVGEAVTRGETLFTVYSPELYAAQEEYVQALRSQQRAQESSTPDRADYLVRAARNRLRLWDIAERDLERITAAGAPLEELPIRAPVSGYVVEKNLNRGSAFEAGARLYRIAPLTKVWIEAEVYEHELPLVHAGQRATVSLPYQTGQELEATIAYVYPTLDPKTRTARVRLEVANPDLALRPDMFANVRVHADRGERLVVPQTAVLHAGERSFVFVEVGDGRFRPQPVEVGLRNGDEVEIVAGLEPGDPIVVSGTFLIASESRLRAAMEQW
jgi:Cu(I)/Ag(I) efflux system membrane fusion protein